MSKKARRRPSWKKQYLHFSIDQQIKLDGISKALIEKIFDVWEDFLKSGAGNE